MIRAANSFVKGAYGRPWEIQAQTRIKWVGAQADEAARCNGDSDHADNEEVIARKEPIHATIVQRLADAEQYLGLRHGPLRWLYGTRVQGAWSNVHAAEVHLLEIACDHEASALVTGVRNAVLAYLPENDSWRTRFEEWMQEAKCNSRNDHLHLDPFDREFVSNAFRRAAEASAERYTQLRRFRNILIGSAVLFAILAGVLALVGVLWPRAVSLCFDGTNRSLAKVCPTGASEPGAGDIALVMLLGMIGGAVAGARSLTGSTRATVTALTLRPARIFQKVTLGGMTAVVGMLFLRAGLVIHAEAPKGFEILAYPVLFGASQQFFTRWADQSAEALLRSASIEVEHEAGD